MAGMGDGFSERDRDRLAGPEGRDDARGPAGVVVTARWRFLRIPQRGLRFPRRRLIQVEMGVRRLGYAK
jgi:hypothetical protein